jgi:hypothetical protein
MVSTNSLLYRTKVILQDLFAILCYGYVFGFSNFLFFLAVRSQCNRVIGSHGLCFSLLIFSITCKILQLCFFITFVHIVADSMSNLLSNFRKC